MKPQNLAHFLAAALAVGRALAQTSIQYVDFGINFTGIVESKHDVTYGFVLPDLNNEEFIGQVISPLENEWVGVALGGPNSLMVVGWPHVNLTEDVNLTHIHGSARFVDSTFNASLYGSANVSTIEAIVNDTHWKWTYRCENCTTWPGGNLAYNGSQELTWLVGLAPVDTPSLDNSTLSADSDLGKWEEDFAGAQSANYTEALDSSVTASSWSRAPMFPSGVGQSQFGPALVAHIGRLFAAGVLNNNSLWYATGNNTVWDQQTTFIGNEVAQEGPALATLGATLHLVFPDKTTGKFIHMQYNDTSRTWGQRLVLNYTTNSRQAALTSFNGSLVMAFYNTSDSNRLNVASWTPNGGWSSAVNLGERTWGTPSLYINGNGTSIFLLFTAADSDRDVIEISSNQITSGWKRVTPPKESTAFGTSAAQFVGDDAMMGFQSNNGKGQLFVSFFDGNTHTWAHHEDTGETSSHTPALAVLNGELNCIFTSRNADSVVLRVTRPLLAYPLDSWMNHLNGGLLMSQLSLPGTHDSAAVTFVPFTETQTLNITQQLNVGIRVFDLRCVLVEDVLLMFHGVIPLGTTLQQLLAEMTNWFQSSATRQREALVVSIKKEQDSIRSNIEFDQAVYQVIQGQNQFWVTSNSIPTLDQIRGKMQLVRRYTAVDNTTVGIDFRIGIDASSWPDNTPNASIPIPNGNLIVEDHYDYDGEIGFNNAVENKTAIVQAALNGSTKDTQPTNWHISFASASNTPWHSPRSFAIGGTQISSIPFVHVDGVNPRLLAFVNNMLLQGTGAALPKIGTVMMDFPEASGGLPASIIELNGQSF